jgi:MFS family permease
MDQLTLRNLRIEIVATVLAGLGSGMIVPFLAIMALKYGGSAVDTALIAAAPMAANLLALLWGRLTQRADRVKLLYLFHGTARIFILLMAFTTQSSVLVLLTVLFFLMLSVAMPSYVGLMQAIYPEAKRATCMAYVRISGGIAIIAGTYFGGHWLEGRFQLAVLIAFGLGLAGMAVFSRIREPMDVVRIQQRADESGVFKESMSAIRLDGAFQLLLLGIFVFEFSQLLPSSLFPIYQMERLRLTFDQIGLLSIVMSVASLLFNQVWGSVIDRYSAIPVMLLSALLGALYPLVYWLSSYPLVIICGTFAAGASGAGMDLAWISYISRVSGRHISSYSGVYLTMVGVRGILAPLIGAALSKHIGMDAVLALSFSFTVLSWVPFLLLLRRRIEV